jgi:hypothetical protein
MFLLRMINLNYQFFRLFLTLVLKEKNKKWTAIKEMKEIRKIKKIKEMMKLQQLM